MTVRRIGDWGLEDGLADSRTPMVAMFLFSGSGSQGASVGEMKLLEGAYPDVRFVLIDLAENPSLADRFLIRRMPTTIVFLGGVETARHEGSSGLIRLVRQALGPVSGAGGHREASP